MAPRSTSMFLVLLLLAAPLLTGCLGLGGEDDGDQVVREQEAEVTGQTGGIQGVVTDSAIQPVTGVTVELVGTGEATTTASDGSYAFSRLAPGDYTVRVNATGFLPVEQDVTVSSGDVAIVDFTVERLTGQQPFMQQVELTGFVECSTRTLGVGFAACAVPNLLLGTNATNDRFLLPFEIQPNPYQMVVEAQWEATQPAGTVTAVIVEPLGLSNDNKTEFGEYVGESPARIMTDRERVLEIDANATAVCDGEKDPQSAISAPRDNYCNRNIAEEGGDGQVRLFVSHAAEAGEIPEGIPCVEGICTSGRAVGVGFAIQQEYNLIITTFHHAPACEDYSVFAGNLCEQQQVPAGE